MIGGRPSGRPPIRAIAASLGDHGFLAQIDPDDSPAVVVTTPDGEREVGPNTPELPIWTRDPVWDARTNLGLQHQSVWFIHAARDSTYVDRPLNAPCVALPVSPRARTVVSSHASHGQGFASDSSPE